MKESLESQFKRLLNVDKSFYLDYLMDVNTSGGDINYSIARNYMNYLNLDTGSNAIHDFFANLIDINEDFDVEKGDANEILIPELKKYTIHWKVRETETVLNYYKLSTYGFNEELIQNRLDDGEFDYYDGNRYDTDYLDSDVGSIDVIDIDEDSIDIDEI